MRQLWSSSRLLIIAAVIGLAALCSPTPAYAIHFRYGHLTWTRVDSQKAQFTLTCAFARNDYTGSAPDGFPAVGDRFQESVGDTELDFGDGTPLQGGPGGGGLIFVAVAIDPVLNYVIGRAIDPVTQLDRIVHAYPSSNNLGQPWAANIDSCCRLLTLNNNPGASYYVETDVDLAASSGSAVSSLPPIIPVPQSGASFFVPATDAEGSTIRYMLSPNAGVQVSGQPFQNPPNATIDPVTGEYTVPTGLATGLWCTQIVIQQLNSSGTVIGNTALDFIFQVQTPVNVPPAVFNYPPTPQNGGTLTAIVGRPFSYLVSASDSNGNVVTLNTTGGPLGSSQVSALPYSGIPAVSSLSWTPTASDVGVYSVTYTAVIYGADNTIESEVITSVNIAVIQPIQLLEPNGGEAYPAGSLQRVRWTSQGFTRKAGLQISLSLDSGVSFPVVLSQGAPDTGSFSWTPTAAEVTQHARVQLVDLGNPLDFVASAADFAISSSASQLSCMTPPGAPVTIPDNNPVYSQFSLPVTTNQIIWGMTVSVNVDHPDIHDLDIALQGPDGTVAELWRQSGTRGQPLPTFGYGTGLTPPYDSFLTAFYGKKSVGTWVLLIRDLAPGDVGTFSGWCLNVFGPPTGTFAITSPAGGEQWATGTTHALTWTETGISGNANIQLSRTVDANGKNTNYQTIATVPAGADSYQWTVTDPSTTTASIQLISVDEPAEFADSNQFSIQDPFVTVTQPIAGEALSVGNTANIQWQVVPTDAPLTLQLSLDGGNSYSTLASNVPNTGTYAWVPQLSQVTNQAVIQVTSQTKALPSPPSGVSGTFIIQNASVTVAAPAVGATWYTFTSQTIQWSTVGVTGNVNVLLSRDGGAHFNELLFAGKPANGSVSWTVTGPSTQNAMIQVISVNQPSLFAYSGSFTIQNMAITVTSPAGGEDWGQGTTHTITWTQQGVPGNVDLDLMIFTSPAETTTSSITNIATNVPDGGSYVWTVNLPAGLLPTQTAAVRVTAHGFPAFGVSPQVFSLVNPSLTITSPNGGEVFQVGQTYNIDWTSQGLTGQVSIALSRDGGATYTPLFASAGNNDGSTSSIAWTVTGPDTSQAKIQITSLDLNNITSTSAKAFQIVSPGLTVTGPLGGVTLLAGSFQVISWTSQAINGDVEIQLSRDGGSTWEVVTPDTANTGTFNWLVTGPGTNNALVQVTALSDPDATALSPVPFTITVPFIQLGAPLGGQTILIGSKKLITWATTGITGSINIDLSTDGGSTWQSLASNQGNTGSYVWTVTGPVTTAGRIRVSVLGQPSLSDQSHSNFSIALPSLIVTAPANKEKWKLGTVQSITWAGDVVNAGGTVNILLSLNGGKKYTTILQNVPDTGSVSWLVSGKTSTTARIQVQWIPATGTSPGATGVSTGNFTILKK